MTETVISIDGMSCMHCVMKVKKALEVIAGVSSVQVSVGSASVTYDETKASRKELEDAIVKAGYRIKN